MGLVGSSGGVSGVLVFSGGLQLQERISCVGTVPGVHGTTGRLKDNITAIFANDSVWIRLEGRGEFVGLILLQQHFVTYVDTRNLWLRSSSFCFSTPRLCLVFPNRFYDRPC